MKKYFFLAFWLVCCISFAQGVPSPATPELIGSNGDVLDALINGVYALRVAIINPASITASVTIATISAQLATGTNEIGEVGPDSASVGSATANSSRPFGTLLHVSDSANIQRLLAAVILGDGVNGNNMLSICNWAWNGASWDRVPGDKTNGLRVDEGSYNTASTSFYTPSSAGAVQQITLLSAVRSISLISTGSFEVYLGSTTVTASGVPVYDKSFPVGSSAVVMVGQTATNSTIQVDQVGR
jgi:hypothetical protein